MRLSIDAMEMAFANMKQAFINWESTGYNKNSKPSHSSLRESYNNSMNIVK